MRTALVIGGTRNLGPSLVDALLRRGDRVAVLSRGRSPHQPPSGVERLVADRTDEAALAAALARRSFDLVVDTTLFTGRDAAAVAALLAGRVGRYVMWSSGQVYLVRAGCAPPFREDDYDGPTLPEPPADRPHDRGNWTYGVDKRAAEEAMRDACAERGFPVVILRPPMIHSPRDPYARLPNYVHRLLDGGPILVPEDGSPPIRHVWGDDVVAATLRAADEPVVGLSLNVGQDDTWSLETLLARLAELCGVPLRLRPLSRVRLEAQGLLPACSPFSSRWMSALDNTRARALLRLSFASMTTYLPPLVALAQRRAAGDVPGYEQRPAELAHRA